MYCIYFKVMCGSMVVDVCSFCFISVFVSIAPLLYFVALMCYFLLLWVMFTFLFFFLLFKLQEPICNCVLCRNQSNKQHNVSEHTCGWLISSVREDLYYILLFRVHKKIKLVHCRVGRNF